MKLTKQSKKDTRFIDWQREGNLIACCGSDMDIKVYDIREGSIVKTFENLHDGTLS